jgi:hypothetical protein
MNPIIKSQPPKLMLDLFCLLLIQFNQSSERKKERKCNKQINQQSISLSFVRLSQFNSIQEKK